MYSSKNDSNRVNKLDLKTRKVSWITILKQFLYVRKKFLFVSTNNFSIHCNFFFFEHLTIILFYTFSFEQQMTIGKHR